MTQGIFLPGYTRPKSKKAIKEAIALGIEVRLQATSFFGNEYDGPVSQAPQGTYTFRAPFIGPSVPGHYRVHWQMYNSAGDSVRISRTWTIWADFDVRGNNGLRAVDHP